MAAGVQSVSGFEGPASGMLAPHMAAPLHITKKVISNLFRSGASSTCLT